ncbi:hypothetical protein A1O7_08303 [Cladophialophora yegresii CBS 114405]|uniref:Cytosolic endo-beta-N-acetylglucosaminidase TIM barrel domain-containing protein n=1 Tax=Cladophialophora yegresii CBS 114405 TaxID=1182544 RepID=W9VTB1_9EURO|nr:uncharacterized protein A1O7_08303 [Cladophialophora yegresii CBS 114405]EXJ55376.1 hypothetical protein A1O7_08303 [Cladophialophora yegresii CBS 114405]
MASCYGFDGWLLNVEAKTYGLDKETWRDGEAMDEFIRKLKEGLVNHGVPNEGSMVADYEVQTDESVMIAGNTALQAA